MSLKTMKKFIDRVSSHDVPGISAQMAYFFVLSIFPMMVFILAITAKISLDSGWIIQILMRIVPMNITELITNYVKNYIVIDDIRIISISIIGTLWTASKSISALIKALNKAYEVKENRGFIITRLLDMVYTVIVVLSIAVSLLIPIMGLNFFISLDQLLNKYLDLTIPLDIAGVFNSLRWIGVLLFLYIVLLSVYIILPNKKIHIKDVLWGTLFSTLGWVLLSIGFSYAVNNFMNFSVVYGSLATVVILMVWLYFSGMILMIGGEINAFYALRHERT